MARDVRCRSRRDSAEPVARSEDLFGHISYSVIHIFPQLIALQRGRYNILHSPLDATLQKSKHSEIIVG